MDFVGGQTGEERRGRYPTIVPLNTSRPASWPVRSAMKDSREVVVGSSAKTSSRRVVRWMADSMEEVGVVTTSPAEEHQRRHDGRRKVVAGMVERS